MSHIAFAPNVFKHELIDKFLKVGSPEEIEKELIKKCSHISIEEKKKNIFTKYYRHSRAQKAHIHINEIANRLAKKKNIIETFLIEAILISIIKELYEFKNFNKAGVDYKNDNLFFWFEIKNEDNKSYDNIAKLISKYNSKYITSGVKISYIIVEEFLELDIPKDYRELEISSTAK